MKLFSIYDVKTETYSAPFAFQTIPAALRAFSDMVNQERGENPYSAHPEDYVLYEIADFCPQKGEVEPNVFPTSLGKGSDFLTSNNFLVKEES